MVTQQKSLAPGKKSRACNIHENARHVAFATENVRHQITNSVIVAGEKDAVRQMRSPQKPTLRKTQPTTTSETVCAHVPYGHGINENTVAPRIPPYPSISMFIKMIDTPGSCSILRLWEAFDWEAVAALACENLKATHHWDLSRARNPGVAQAWALTGQRNWIGVGGIGWGLAVARFACWRLTVWISSMIETEGRRLWIFFYIIAKYCKYGTSERNRNAGDVQVQGEGITGWW